MRTIVVTVLLVAGTVARGAAQQAPAPAPQSNQANQANQSSDEAAGYLHEPAIIGRAIHLSSKWLGGDGTPSKDGFYPEVGGMVTGAGWISAGPGYRRSFFDQHLTLDGSAAISWRAYKNAQARVEVTNLAQNHLAVGFHVQWQDLTQVNYFGIGSGSSEDLRSEYRLRSTDLAGYGVYRLNDWLSVGGRFGWINQPKISSPVGPFDRNFPDTQLVFPDDPGVQVQTSLLNGAVAAEADTRDHPSRPTHGGLYRAVAQIYSDHDLHQFSFRRYEAEGLQILPLAGERWVLALHGWGVFSDTSGGNTVPFYLLPSLGGGNTLRGFSDYRFHDQQMLVANVESRWALFEHIDAAAFVDVGNVAARVGDLNLAKKSYGGGVRVHSRTATLARVDLSHSREGWEFAFRLSDPFRLARRSLRFSVIPFVP